MRLDREFFSRPVSDVACDLVGQYFVKETDHGRIVAKIVETEAYGDSNDLASHARFSTSNRNEIMFDKPGLLYVYQIYGIFFLANIICETKGKAGAVLIRAAEVIEGEALARANLAQSKFVANNTEMATGPGKFSLVFELSKKDNYRDLCADKVIYCLKNHEPVTVISAKRVGIEYADYCRDYLWRFYMKDNLYVSKK